MKGSKDVLRVGLVGFGYWGPNVARNLYNNSQIDLKYICDLKPDRLAKARGIYAESVKYTQDYTCLLYTSCSYNLSRSSSKPKPCT